MSPSSSHASGASPQLGATVVYASDPTIGAGTSLLWDTTQLDTSGFYSAVTGRFTIPAGKGGLYLFTIFGQASSGVAITDFRFKLLVNGTPNNATFAGEIEAGSVVANSAGAMIASLAVGDNVSSQIQLGGPATVALSAASSAFSVAYLGSLP